MLTKDRTMATIQAEALAYMICATFFFDGGNPAEDEKSRRRLEASAYLLSDLLQVAVNGGADK